MFYQHQVNDIENKVRVRRQEEAMRFGYAKQSNHPVTLLELKLMIAPLLSQLQTLAKICLTQSFIERLNLLNQDHKNTETAVAAADVQFESMLYKRNTFARTSFALTEQNLEILK